MSVTVDLIGLVMRGYSISTARHGMFARHERCMAGLFPLSRSPRAGILLARRCMDGSGKEAHESSPQEIGGMAFGWLADFSPR